MPAGKPLELNDFTGGLNVLDSPFDLALNQSPDLLNYVPAGVGGALTQRDGDTTLAGSGVITRITDLFMVRTLATLGLVIALADTGQMWSIDPAGGAATSIRAGGGGQPGGTFIEAPVSGGQGPLYGIVPDVGAANRLPVQWTGAGAVATWTASTGTVPIAKKLLWANNRVWGVGSSANAATAADLSSYRWSEIGDPRNWPAANINQLDSTDGDQFTTAAAWGSSIIVFKPRKAWLVYDLDTGANRPLTFGAGARTIAITTPEGVVFDDPDQGWMITDGSTVRKLPNGDLAGLDWRKWTIDSGVYFGNSVYIGADIALGTHRIFEYDMRLKAWFVHDGASVITDGSQLFNGIPALLFAAKRMGTNVITFKTPGRLLAQDGTALATRYTSPWLHAGAPSNQKRIVAAFIEGQGDLTASLRRDFAPAVALTRGPFTLDPAIASSREQRLNDLGVARALQLQLDGSSLTRAARIDAVRLYLLQRGR